MEAEMKYIYTVYQQGSFSKAANRLFMTQPALSIAVQRVERKIGMPLFNRTSKPLTLTEAGELYIRKYSEIADLENELEQQINDLSSLQTGSLRVGGSHYFNAYVLPPVLTEYMNRYPGINLQLTESDSHDLLNLLYEHEIDLTFNCSEHPKDSFIRRPVFRDTLLLAVPKNYVTNDHLRETALTTEDILYRKKHLQTETPGIDLTQLKDTPFLFLSTGNDLRLRSLQFCADSHFTPQIRLQISQLVTVWHLVCSGLGAAFISDFLVKPDSENVLFYKIPSPQATRIFDITMSDRHYVSNAMKAFEKTFRRWYGGI